MKIFLFLFCCGLASQAFLGNVSASFTGANGTDTERARVKRVIEVDDEYYITHKNELKNVALHKPAVQSSTYYILRANLAVDGNTNPKVSAGSCTYTNRNSGVREWWAVDLGQMYRIYFIDITPRWDECPSCRQRFRDFDVVFYQKDPRTPGAKQTSCYYHSGPLISPSTVSTQCHNGPANGRWVQIMNNPTNYLTLCEVQIYGIATNSEWTVFQRRQDGSVDFYRGWADYRNGFGDPSGEFWLGLETLHQMTSDGRKYELRFDLEKQDGSKYYAEHDDFSIDSEGEGYAVHITGYRGNAGNSFISYNGFKFMTKDQDHGDTIAYSKNNYRLNWAHVQKGGWWYKNGTYVNLNGVYSDAPKYYERVYWYSLGKDYPPLKKTEMKFRVKQ